MHAWGQAAVFPQCPESEVQPIGMNGKIILQAALMYVKDAAKLCVG